MDVPSSRSFYKRCLGLFLVFDVFLEYIAASRRSFFGHLSISLKYLVCVACMALLPCHYVSASVDLSAEQIERFKQLSPEEQKMLADSLGIDLEQVLTSSTQPKQVVEFNTVTPRAVPSAEVTEQTEANQASSVAPPPATQMLRSMTPATGPMAQSVPMSTSVHGQPLSVEAQLQQRNLQQGTEIYQSLSDELEAQLAPTYQKTTDLQPYGYDLFAGTPTTFAPVTDIPVPMDYVVGPGDTILVQLYGKENRSHELTVSREGMVQFPQVGPVSVNGLKFGELKTRIHELVSEHMIGIKASVTMGELRSIRVFVLGEAYRPGSYTVSALSTMTNALFVSGGIKVIGSLRNIQLKRQGEVVATLDLYDLLMRGDTRQDKRLQPGDVLFVPPLGKTAAIIGEVRRPAVYELTGNEQAADLVRLSGGYLPTAYEQASRIERIDLKGDRTVQDIDLASPAGRASAIKNGDLIRVYSVLDKLENVVVLSGHVHRPGFFKWRKNMKVSDVLTDTADLKRYADLDFALLKHQSGPQGLFHFDRVHLREALAKSSWADIELAPRDELIVFSAGSDRQATVEPFVQALTIQAPHQAYPKVVSIKGNVKFPGDYPLLRHMTVGDGLAIAGGALPETLNRSFLVHQDAESGVYSVELLTLDNPKHLTQKLYAYDQLLIVAANEDREELLADLIESLKVQATKQEASDIMSVRGAVEFPGEYPFVAGVRLQDLIELAGGLAENAYGLSAEITHQQITGDDEFKVIHQPLDLQQSGEMGLGYRLSPRDQVIIKQIPNWNEVRTVMVQGEVKFPGKYPIASGETLAQVIARAGGVTEHADPAGAVFLRQTLKEKEMEALTKFQAQIEQEVVLLEQQAQASGNELAEQKAVAARLMQDLDSAQATGRLVIDLPNLLAGDARHDVLLRENDEILVPTQVQEVSIVGEVQFPTSHLFVDRLSTKAYLNKSGWLTRNADKKRIYMIGRDGNVRPMYKWRFMFLSIKNKPKPGDTIVVPMEVGKLGALAYWGEISEILFQLATTAAALDTVGAL